MLSSAEIRNACTMLLEQDIHSSFQHVGNQEITTKIAARQHDVAFDKRFPDASKQSILPVHLPLYGPIAASITAFWQEPSALMACPQKHRQRHRGWILTLPMFRQLRLNSVQ
jgi:hypothetical protein